MNALDLLQLIEKTAKEYRVDAQDSLDRNSHMNHLKKEFVTQKVIDAVLVDFINFMAMKQCIDYGLYVSDFTKGAEMPTEEPLRFGVTEHTTMAVAPIADFHLGNLTDEDAAKMDEIWTIAARKPKGEVPKDWPTYYKGDRVILNKQLFLQPKDSEIEGVFLYKGEIFECTDYAQPGYMDYLHVICNGNKLGFALPMEHVKKMS